MQRQVSTWGSGEVLWGKPLLSHPRGDTTPAVWYSACKRIRKIIFIQKKFRISKFQKFKCEKEKKEILLMNFNIKKNHSLI